MAADLLPTELESAEALREVIFSQRRELDTLRRETADVEVLLGALDALLEVDGDPFERVFAILGPVFRFSAALVLLEQDVPGSTLTCIVATAPSLVDGEWRPERLFEKVLRGRVTATMTSEVIAASPAAAVDNVVTSRQPALYFPLAMRHRRGMMVLLREGGDEGFDRRDIALAGKFSLLASHALAALSANRSENERKRLHRLTGELEVARAALARRANYDFLTGLPNRGYFEERVRGALSVSRHRPLALAFIDLDGFKQVNDRYGHEAGDNLLAQVADRVVGHIRSTDVLARLSGDEFILLVDPLEDRDVLDAIIERILVALKEPFRIGDVRVVLSASIGIATYPDHGSDYDELRRNADVAMYSAKSRSKGTAAHFDVSLGRAVAERAEAEQGVRQAVAERLFRPVLQPLVHLDTMDITGFEMLARREDEHGRLHPPQEFISLAGELGLLDAITHMLVDQVTATMPALDEHFGSHTTVSINVSARQATDVPGMRRLLGRLERCGYADRFVVEVTEDAYLHADVFERDVLPLLREAGVRVSIDDFGTGYSSLGTLLALDVHELKIDRAFITDVQRRPRSQVILRAIASTAAELGLSVVAEGVETEDDLHHLRSIPSIDTGQGYLFARPAQPAELIRSAPEILDRLRSLRSSAMAMVAARR